MARAKLSRQKAHRMSLSRNLLTSLVLEKRIITTEAKAKYILPEAEKFLKAAIGATDATRRLLAAQLTNNTAVKELFNKVVPELSAKTAGGLVKIIKVEARFGDQAKQAAVIINRQVKPKTDKQTDKAKK